MKKRLCGRCKGRPPASKHFNSKWCTPCANELKRRPKSTMTPEQVRQAKGLIGKMSREDISEHLGVSVASLKRAFRGTRLAYFNKWSANPELTRRVCEYYEEHGRAETEKAFPHLRIRSALERYPLFKPRQIRWTDEQLVEVAKMAGLVGFDAQARYFNRPRANAGAIKSVWMKRYGFSGGGIHGMSDWMAKYLVTDRCPRTRTAFWETRKKLTRYGRKLCLWVDMERHLRRETPEFVGDAVRTMAEFQRWLFRSQQPKRAIMALMRERQ